MLTYQIVVEADNAARYVLQFDDLNGLTYAAPGVSVLSQNFIENYMAQNGFSDIPSVLGDMGVTNDLSADDLATLAAFEDAPATASPGTPPRHSDPLNTDDPGNTAGTVYSSDSGAGTGATTADPTTAFSPGDTLLSGALADLPTGATVTGGPGSIGGSTGLTSAEE
jgi:hypothetical protein